MINGPDLLQLDARIEAAVRAWNAWRRLVRNDLHAALEQDPFVGTRPVSTRASYQSALGLPEEVPQREALSRWIATLTIERVTFEDARDTEQARRSPDHSVRSLGAQPWSIRDLVLEAALHPDGARRALAADALPEAADDASSNALFWSGRRHDAARQLGLDSLEQLEAPLRGGLEPRSLADSVLQATDSLADEVIGRPRGWQDAVALGVARDAVEGWPAQLGLRWLQDLFGGTELTQGIPIDLSSVEPAIAGASFARALALFGESYARGAARTVGKSFSLAVRPFDLLESSFGALFGGLLASAAFGRRRLGLGQVTARAQSRSFVRSQVIALRLIAVQTAVAACADSNDARMVHEAYGTRALRATLPAELAAIAPRYRPTAASRLAGALHAAAWRDRLVGEHDEDWFDNPRAHQELRQVDPLRRVTLDADEAKAGIASFVRQASEALS